MLKINCHIKKSTLLYKDKFYKNKETEIGNNLQASFKNKKLK